MDIQNVLQCYELFESVIEWDLDGLKSIHVVYSANGNKSTFLIEAECEKGFEDYEFFEYIGHMDIEREANTLSVALYWNNESAPEEHRENEPEKGPEKKYDKGGFTG